MNKTKPSLLQNTFFLYLITFSNYLFGLITLPYETRILGPEAFGLLGFAAAFYTYFYVIFDFGFILCGTRMITQNADNHSALEKIVSGITMAKILLFAITAVVFLIICLSIDRLADNLLLLMLYLVYAGVTCLIPDYLYRGLENMKMITLRTVLVRFVFTCLIFIFLRRPEQVYLIPLFNIVGTMFALIWIFYDIRTNLKINIKIVPLKYVFSLVKEAFMYFTSRIASTVYSATNMIILGFVYPGSPLLGYYTSVDKVRVLASQAASPVADSFYPYMIRTKDYHKLFKITALFECVIVLGCALLWVFAKEFCTIFFGQEYLSAYSILRCTIPLMALILPNYMLGFPALSPIGMSKWANNSVIIAMVNQLIGIAILFLSHNLSVYSIIILTTISEFICLMVRTAALIHGRKHSNK